MDLYGPCHADQNLLPFRSQISVHCRFAWLGRNGSFIFRPEADVSELSRGVMPREACHVAWHVTFWLNICCMEHFRISIGILVYQWRICGACLVQMVDCIMCRKKGVAKRRPGYRMTCADCTDCQAFPFSSHGPRDILWVSSENLWHPDIWALQPYNDAFHLIFVWWLDGVFVFANGCKIFHTVYIVEPIAVEVVIRKI